MRTPRALFSLLIIAIVALVALSVVLMLNFDVQKSQLELDLAKGSAVIDLLEQELDSRQSNISDLESSIENLDGEIVDLGRQVSSLENEIASRTCQAISLEEFDRRVRLGTTYVITPGQMGWTGYWNIRESVIFERTHELARGYEIRIDLTPEIPWDDWQEIHTTIRAFQSAQSAKNFYDGKSGGDDTVLVDVSLDLGTPVKLWRQNGGDVENTVTISMLCDIYQADIKIKLLEDQQQAIAYLEEAAEMLFHDLSVWVP